MRKKTHQLNKERQTHKVSQIQLKISHKCMFTKMIIELQIVKHTNLNISYNEYLARCTENKLASKKQKPKK